MSNDHKVFVVLIGVFAVLVIGVLAYSVWSRNLAAELYRECLSHNARLSHTGHTNACFIR